MNRESPDVGRWLPHRNAPWLGWPFQRVEHTELDQYYHVDDQDLIEALPMLHHMFETRWGICELRSLDLDNTMLSASSPKFLAIFITRAISYVPSQ